MDLFDEWIQQNVILLKETQADAIKIRLELTQQFSIDRIKETSHKKLETRNKSSRSYFHTCDSTLGIHRL